MRPVVEKSEIKPLPAERLPRSRPKILEVVNPLAAWLKADWLLECENIPARSGVTLSHFDPPAIIRQIPRDLGDSALVLCVRRTRFGFPTAWLGSMLAGLCRPDIMPF